MEEFNFLNAESEKNARAAIDACESIRQREPARSAFVITGGYASGKTSFVQQCLCEAFGELDCRIYTPTVLPLRWQELRAVLKRARHAKYLWFDDVPPLLNVELVCQFFAPDLFCGDTCDPKVKPPYILFISGDLQPPAGKLGGVKVISLLAPE